MIREGAHVIAGPRAVEEALRARRRLHEIVVQAGSEVGALTAEAERSGVPIRTADDHEIAALAGGVAHQGVLARAPAFHYLDLAEVTGELVVVLDQITDPQNLGAIARSAEAAGASALVLPKRRSVRVTPAAERAAAGAFSWLPVAPDWCRVTPAPIGWCADAAFAGKAADQVWRSNRRASDSRSMGFRFIMSSIRPPPRRPFRS